MTAYVEAPLCEGAQRRLAAADGRAGAIRVRAVCLAGARSGREPDLAAIGANARRAAEDSTAIAYVEPPATPSFSRPIVEAAAIPVLRGNSGAKAMTRLLAAIEEADADSLRESVLGAL